MLKKQTIIGGLTALALATQMAVAAVSPKEAERLKKDLTPIGAEKAGNKAGTIPAWTGGLQKSDIPKSYTTRGQHYPNPYPGDKPQFVITADNLSKYQANLTPGQIALFKAYPKTFKIPVYKTRRSGSLPQFVYDNTIKHATTAKLNNGGNGFTGAYAGFPFPIPKDGLEALWNHIVRYRGEYGVRKAAGVPVHRNGNYTPVITQQEAFFKYYDPNGSESTLDNIIIYYLAFTTSPARLAGGSVLVHETLDQVKQPRQAWGYNAGQRRVRRAPNLAYDTPISAADGLIVADDTDMYNGAPDRYNWKLVGKKEIYIPYNNYELISPKLKNEDILKVGHVNPDHTRYELHRVWVVEGTLKPGERHIYSKRVLYLDEDSWGAAVVDQYDGRGELWRVSMAYLLNNYDLPTTWTGLDVFHDLQARRYYVQGLANEESTYVDFSKAIPDDKYFKPAALRRRGRR
ncbi:DUF1329 domain-containing protein [Endozoicomonas sp. SM1973]|uniref:DUF1329 domain-containing protein n=1 Tax=Spartinivicinus marinus TaxID=2994442 RepID=A0A853I8L3_9GAMM|nr:DUF1329 domain-containing protein [Spartinivicinus marinus]MCX4024927.1 DUF1329 domain-containing protein [Spartinivicinus marinus]NYZ69179.1 DUF1329 domain-containing protein [Spartinivicinus marinus]